MLVATCGITCVCVILLLDLRNHINVRILRIVLFLFFQLHAVSRMQQGRQRESIVGTLRSAISSSGDRTHDRCVKVTRFCPCTTIASTANLVQSVFLLSSKPKQVKYIQTKRLVHLSQFKSPFGHLHLLAPLLQCLEFF